MSENTHVAFDTELCGQYPSAAADRITDLEYALINASAAIADALKVYSAYDKHKMDIDAYEKLKACRFTILRVL